MLTNKNKLRDPQEIIDIMKEDFKKKRFRIFFMEENFISEENSIDKIKEFSFKYKVRIIIKNYAVIVDGIMKFIN